MCKVLFSCRVALAPLLVFQLAAAAFASEAPLTLAGAVKQALKKNPEIQQLQHRLRAMEAKAKQAPYLEDPQIAFQLGGVPFSNPTSFNQADTNSIGIRQMVPFFGKLGLKEKIAQREVNIAEQELRAKEREIIAMIKMSYADLFMAQRSVEILREQLEIVRVVIGATEARYRVGKWRSRMFSRRSWSKARFLNQLIVAEEEITVATVKLNTAMYRPPRTPVQIRRRSHAARRCARCSYARRFGVGQPSGIARERNGRSSGRKECTSWLTETENTPTLCSAGIICGCQWK